MKKLLCLTVCAVLVGAVALALPVSAQPRDAGFKVRGDFGRPSGRTTRSVSPARRTVVRGPFVQPGPAEDLDESYRSFAFEPLNVGRGDKVLAAADKVRLMRGSRVVGTAARGDQLTVLRVQGPWIGTEIETDEGAIGGWVWYDQVVPAENAR